MSSAAIEHRLRRFLLIVVECLCLGTMVELWLRKHVKEPLQFIPFILCTLGALTILGVLIRPEHKTIWAMRIVMVFLILGSLLGMTLHLVNNYEFEAEMRPGVAAGDILLQALMGASPLLAPGMLALAGVLAIAATYYHPSLSRPETTAA